MKKKIILWEISSTIFTILLGSLLHFVFKWSGCWKPLGLFAAVNESVWEHLKLAFWPALFFSLAEAKALKGMVKNFLPAKAALLLIPPALIAILFYAYTAILGYNLLAVDISIFVISVIIGQLISYKLLTSDEVSSTVNFFSVLILIALIFAFVTFTFCPPSLPIFRDPVKGGYGIYCLIFYFIR